MKRSILIIFLSYPLLLFCQGITLGNQATIGGSYVDISSSVISLPNDEFLVVGDSNSPVSGEKTDSCRGSWDYWILKLNSQYQIIWQKTYGGSGYDVGRSAVMVNENKYIIVGESSSLTSGDKTVDNIGGSDIWAICIDSNGTILWQKAYGGSEGEGDSKIIKLSNGTFLISCTSTSGISGNKTETSRGYSDYWILNINESGDILWDKTIGGASYDSYPTAYELNSSEILIQGSSQSNISFEKTQNCYGSWDVWLVKYNWQTQAISDVTLGGSSTDNFGDIVVHQNNIFVVSTSTSNTSGVKTEDSRGETDYWIVRLDTAFNIIWDKTYGGNLYDNSTNIQYTENNEIIVFGSSMSNISGDKTENTVNSNTSHDNWIITIDINGNILRQKNIGGSNFDYASSSIYLPGNKLVCVGASDSGISGNKTDYCRGNFDFWIYELDIPMNASILSLNDLNAYPNPANNLINIYSENEVLNGLLIISDIHGKALVKNDLKNSIYSTIDVSTLQNGIYFLQIQSSTKLLSKKIIIAR